MTKAKPQVRVCGPFIADPDVPADHNGRRVCANCHLPGRAGDAHHPVADMVAQTEHRRRAGDDE